MRIYIIRGVALTTNSLGTVTISMEILAQIHKLIYNLLFGAYVSGSHVVLSDNRDPVSLGDGMHDKDS